jgi:ATP/maltotriose-dependent transcriptional regulator MalT
VLRLQLAYYRKRIAELERDIEKLEARLRRAHFVELSQQHHELSVRFLRRARRPVPGIAARALRRGLLLAPSVTRRLITDFTRKPPAVPAVPAALDVLTSRETEVLTLIAQGMSNTQISDTLCIAGETTRTHIKRILS